jgi:hypothetical protein
MEVLHHGRGPTPPPRRGGGGATRAATSWRRSTHTAATPWRRRTRAATATSWRSRAVEKEDPHRHRAVEEENPCCHRTSLGRSRHRLWCNMFSFAVRWRTNSFGGGQCSIPVAKELSKTRAPPRCKFFMWLVLLGRC